MGTANTNENADILAYCKAELAKFPHLGKQRPGKYCKPLHEQKYESFDGYDHLGNPNNEPGW